MEEKRFSGYQVAIASFIVMFFNLGLLGSTGVFIPHIAKDLGVQPTDIGLMVTFATGGAFLFSMLTNRVVEKISAKNTLILATAINGIHFSIFGIASAPWMVYLGAFLGGAVLAFGSNVVCASIISNWFVEKRATVLGLVFGGAGFGSAAALFVAGQLIDVIGWRKTYFSFTAILLTLGIGVAAIFVKENPADLGQKPLGWDTVSTGKGSDASAAESGMTLEQAKKTKTYWLWMVGILLTSMVITGVVTYAPAYWQSYGMKAVTSSNYTSMVSLIGAATSLVSGVIADKLGVGAYLSYTMISYILGATLLVLFPAPSMVTALLIVFLIALSYPSSTNYPATITTVAFGNKDYTRINSNFQTMVYLSKAALPILIVFLTKAGVSMRQTYMLQIIFATIGFILLMFGLKLATNAKKEKKSKENIIA